MSVSEVDHSNVRKEMASANTESKLTVINGALSPNAVRKVGSGRHSKQF